MQYRHRLPEAPHEAPDDLRRQRDLRHQHDRAPAALQGARGGAQIHLGLARPGDPVQQQRRALGRQAPQAAARSPPTPEAGRRSGAAVGRPICQPADAADGRPRGPGACARRGRPGPCRSRPRAAPVAARAPPSSSTQPPATPPAPPGPRARRAPARAAARAASPRPPRCARERPVTTPSTSRRPNGTTNIEPTPTAPPSSSGGSR